MKKKIFFAILFLFVSILLLPLGLQKAEAKSKVYLNKKSISLKADSKAKIKLLNAKGTVTWSLSDTSVCKITSSKKNTVNIQAISAGKTVLTATYKNKSYNCEITVKKPKVTVTKEGDKIYSANNITVTYKGIKDNKLSLEVNNASSETIRYSFSGVAVNNCMVSTGYSRNDILSGKKSVGTCYLNDKDEYGIKTIESISLYFEVSYPDNSSKKKMVEILYIYLKSEINDFTPSLKGNKIYDDSNITATFINEGKNFDDMAILYKNKTDNTVQVNLFDVSIDDMMIDWHSVLGMDYILPGCYGYSKIEDKKILWSMTIDAIEEAGLTKPNKIDGRIMVWGRSVGKTILETKEIRLYTK